MSVIAAASETTPRAEADRPEADDSQLAEILGKHAGSRGGLIAALADIQTRWGYLPETALDAVARATGRSLVDVYGIATFYRAFSLQPRGKHLICVCLGTACHVRGGPGVAEELERQLGIPTGHTTSDGLFSLEAVNCLGACALGPVVVIDGHYYSKVTKPQVRTMLDDAREGRVGAPGSNGHLLPIEVSCPRCNQSLMDAGHPIDERPSIRVTVCFAEQYGRLRLSSWHGSDSFCAQPDIPAGRVACFLCPFCHQELTDSVCAECDSPLAMMLVRGGGTLRVCARRGCPQRRLDLP